MNRLPIIDKLIALEKSGVASFHVPGHKNGKIFNRLNYSRFINKLGFLDITEIIGTDNLHNPQGIIRDSQQMAKEVFKSKETYFLVNGSTAGIYSMIMATTSPGDKIIINRNCHQSVIQACILGELQPIYVYPEIDLNRGIPLGISPEEVEKLILLNMDARVVLITYPTYEGVASDLKKIGEIVHKYDKILLVDEAHGSHLGLSKDLPKTALECGGDLVVQSTHKTLPAFTQGAMLHVQGNRVNTDKLKFMLRMHQSSSPSYMLMASLELAAMIYKDHGQDLMTELLLNINKFKKKCESINSVSILGNEMIGKHHIFDIDLTKLYISFEKKGITGVWLEEYLRKNFKVQMELSNLNGVLGISSIANEEADFLKLFQGLQSLDKLGNKRDKELLTIPNYPEVQQKYTPREGFYKQKKTVEINSSSGLISGEYVIPYPPGIPILVPGEVISEEVTQYMKIAIKYGINIVGLKDKENKFIEVIV